VATVYFDFQGPAGGGTSPADSRNSFVAPADGDVFRFRRGSTWTRATQANFGAAIDLTLEAYWNADGSDDSSQPKPTFTNTQTASSNSLNFQGNGTHRIRDIRFLNCSSGTNGGVVGMGAVAADAGRFASVIVERCDFNGTTWNAIRSSGVDATASRTIRVLGCTFDNIGEDTFFGCADVFEYAFNRAQNVSMLTDSGDGVGFLGCNPTLAWVHHNRIDHSSRPYKHCIIIDVTTAGSGLALIEDNVLIGSIGYGADNTTIVNMESAGTIRRNRIFSGRVAVNLSGAAGVMEHNYVQVLETEASASIVALQALNCQVLNNTLIGNGTALSPFIASAPSQTGQVMRNNVATQNGIFYSRGSGATETLSNNGFQGITTPYVGGSSTGDIIGGLLLSSDGVPMTGSPLLTGGFDRGYLRDMRGHQAKRYIGAYAAAAIRDR
jgi:hypothetical protein